MIKKLNTAVFYEILLYSRVLTAFMGMFCYSRESIVHCGYHSRKLSAKTNLLDMESWLSIDIL